MAIASEALVDCFYVTVSQRNSDAERTSSRLSALLRHLLIWQAVCMQTVLA